MVANLCFDRRCFFVIEIRIISKKHKQDINIKNEPFSVWGRMIPSYVDKKWGYSVEKFSRENITEMCFPDENYDYDSMCENSVFIGAYDGDKCVGLAIFQDFFFKHMYLYDLKVSKEYRKQKIATKLVYEGLKIAVERGYCGIYTQGQDNNLSACLFYLNVGFHIGGFDTDVYKGTKQEGKSDIIFYMESE